MEKVIKIDVVEDNLLANFNREKVNPELIEYIIKETRFIPKKIDLKLQINNESKIKAKDLLIKAFKEEYQKVINEHKRTNLIQFILFIIGFLFIVISFNINNEILEELFLIGGWVPIWEMVELELFNDVRGNQRRKILLKLINCEIEEKSIWGQECAI